MPFELTPLETRVLGCLVEKERLTPENYPLSLNALTAACNQSTNRDPITQYDEKGVEEGINALREKKLASMVSVAGSRVPKYRHRLAEHFSLEPQEMALMCTLLLRGPQTAGELRTRSERMFRFGSLQDLEQSLHDLETDPAVLVSLLAAAPGSEGETVCPEPFRSRCTGRRRKSSPRAGGTFSNDAAARACARS
jgi:uncharacterized protein YceH (UPF0502 family)